MDALQLRRGAMVRLLLLFLGLLATVSGLHADEAGVVDWHHKLIGTPRKEATFLHKPLSTSGALAFALTDRNVLAALNPRDGTIVWRQLIDDPKVARPLDGTIAVLSGVEHTIVTTFDAQTGHQLYQSPVFPGSPLGLEILSPDWPGDPTRDVITLSDNGHVRRFHHLLLAWDTPLSEMVKGTPRFIATSLSKVYVVSIVPHSKYSSLSVTTLDSVNGAILETHQLDSSLLPQEDVQVVGSHSSTPLAIWHEKGKIKVNVLGTKSITTLAAAHDFDKFYALAPSSSTSLTHFLVAYEDSTSSWAQVYHTNPSTGSITLAYSLPKTPKGPYALAQVNANIFFGKVTLEHGREEADLDVWGSASHARLARYTIPFPTSNYGLAEFVPPQTPLPVRGSLTNEKGVLDVVSRDANSIAARILLTTQDGSTHLFRSSQYLWTREESLSHILPHTTVLLDLPVPEPKAQLHVSSSTLINAYICRLMAHLTQLRNLPSAVVAFGRHFATGSYDEIKVGSVNRDAFGVRKFIIVATERGKVVALDSANGGNVIWSRLLPGGPRVLGMWILRESSAVRGKPPAIGVLLEESVGKKFLQVDGLTGMILEEEPVDLEGARILKSFIAPEEILDSERRRMVLIVTDKNVLEGLPSTPETTGLLSQLADKLYFSIHEGNAIQGYVLNDLSHAVPTWRFEAPLGSHIKTFSSRTPSEKVASIGRVLGDRSVLYKYLNPNLIVVSVVAPATSSLAVYLIDNVSGGIIVEFKYEGVDTSKTVATQITENSVYWTYFGIDGKAGQARGTRITVVELYESAQKNDKYNMSEWTSFNNEYPYVMAKTYLFDHPVHALSSTSTRHGITSRDLLVATPQQLIALPKRLLDPRRPVVPKGGKVNGDEKTEGLLAYDPVIPDERKWTLSHVNELFGITSVMTSPALLESTSLIFASGLDLFFTRVAPSGSFDVLSDSFSKSQLLATIAALVVGMLIMRPLVHRKILNQRWGEKS